MNTRIFAVTAIAAIAAIPLAIAVADPDTEPTTTTAAAPAPVDLCSPEAAAAPHAGTYACSATSEPFTYPWMGDR